MTDERIEVVRNDVAGQYELRLNGDRVSLASFYRRGDAVVIPHTETLPALGGRGLASRLVDFALSDIAAQGLQVIPSCPFVADFIAAHRQYAQLVECRR